MFSFFSLSNGLTHIIRLDHFDDDSMFDSRMMAMYIFMNRKNVHSYELMLNKYHIYCIMADLAKAYFFFVSFINLS